MFRRSLFPALLAALSACFSLPASPLFAQNASDAERMQFFEKKIRPVLVKECYSCHSADAREVEGGLSLDTREGIRKGGDTGPAVVPGSLRRSLLVKAIKQTDDNLQMPPDKKLSAEVIADFEKWIALGADDPREGKAAVSNKYEIDIEKGRQYWAFQRPKKVTIPDVKAADWPDGDVDRLILAAMEEKGLSPVADSDPRSLVRRIYFDLIGLPPSPQEIDEFLTLHGSDPEQAIVTVTDRLLKSPRFGERWGRHWLDVARFAESSGQANNFAYPHAWRYRDWVVNAFNADMPYDDFIRAQLAGDLLPAKDDKEKAANMVATGFLAIGPKSLSERNRRQFQMDVADEQIDATFQAFQALTVACARCHDHRFDPIPQTDYYALAGIFSSTESCYGTIRVIQSNHPSRLLELPKESEATVALSPLTERRRESIEEQIEQTREQMKEITGRDNFIRRIFMQSRVTQLQSELSLYDEEGNPKLLAMGVRDGRFVSDSPLYIRGEIDQPGDRVSRGFPQVLTEQQPRIRFRSSGRRELADWIASTDNPLTARVMVNRIWSHLIGQGLVPTLDNFGASGQRPSHPELLDHLANTFVENGWSVKQLIRTIVLSRTYQLSGNHDGKNFEVDPENVFVWRIPRRRLEAEAIRDTMLHLSGKLDLDPPASSIVAQEGEGSAARRFRGDPATSDTHRSVFLPIVRDQVPEMLSIFDFPDPSLIIGERATTTIPAQSLFMLNNRFVISQAEGLASTLVADYREDRERIEQAYQLCYSRKPTDSEMEKSLEFLEEYGRFRSDRTTWAAFCQAMFASAEFIQK